MNQITPIKFGDLSYSITEKDGETVLDIYGEGPMQGFDYSNPPPPWRHFPITKAVIHEGVTMIGARSFYGLSKLKDVVLPNSLESIGFGAFMGCGIKDIVFPANLDGIAEMAFCGCRNLKGIILPEKMHYISDQVFKDCVNLKKAVLPKSLSYIGAEVFTDCSSLTNVTLPEDLYVVSRGMFDGCSQLPRIEIPKSTHEIMPCAFRGCKSLTEIILSEGVTVIGACSFAGCKGPETLVLPDSLRSIDERAFEGCETKNIFIHKGVWNIGNGAFASCSNLELSVSEDNPYYLLSDGMLYSAPAKALLACSPLRTGTLYIRDGVDCINGQAFSGCEWLKKVVIPKSVFVIGVDAFKGCNSLEEICYKGSPADWETVCGHSQLDTKLITFDTEKDADRQEVNPHDEDYEER